MIKNQLHLTTLLFLFVSTSLLGQTNTSSDYLVLTVGDTLYGTVKHINESNVNPSYYKKIRFKDTNGKKKKYKRTAIAAFRVNNAIYEGFWLQQSSQKITLLNPRYDISLGNGEQHFLRVMSKGPLSHYQMEWWEQGESTLWSMDLFKKEEDPFLIRITQGLFGLKRKLLRDYFQNCQDLGKRIKQKQLKEVREIVDFYHRNCMKKSVQL